jgi:hypothetical protein
MARDRARMRLLESFDAHILRDIGLDQRFVREDTGGRQNQEGIGRA